MTGWLGRIARCVAAALLSALSLAVAPGAAAEEVLAPSTITVEGRGWGHGRGLSQWGALGYAVDYGWTSAEILDHYYGGTSAGVVPEEDFDVHLTVNDGRPLLLTAGVDFEVGGEEFAAGEIARLEVRGVANFAVVRTAGCGDPGTDEVTGLAGIIGQNGHPFVAGTSSNPDPSVDDPTQLLTMIRCDPDDATSEIERRAYRGQIGLVEIGGVAYSFNRLPLEQYLRGVVPRESPSWWGSLGGGAGVRALEAQAVAARSYALSLGAYRESVGYFTDACDTTACQVYGGAWLNGLPLDHGSIYASTNTAIAATSGLVRLRGDGSVAFTEFASSSGGWTAPLSEGSGYPDVEDLGDAYSSNTNYEWTTTIQRTAIEDQYPAIGQLVRIRVTERNGLGPWGGRTRGMVFEGTEGSVEVSIDNWGDDDFRRAFGLKSDWYRFAEFPEVRDPGFWLAKSDGSVMAFGDAEWFGDASAVTLPNGIVGLAAHPDGNGYWLVTEGGDIYAYGSAEHRGSLSGTPLNQPIVGMAPHPGGQGYWLAASDGGVFAFGSARFLGSMGHVQLNQPVVGIEASPSGDGYWMVAADGGIFAFGDAGFFGSTGNITLNKPITSMTAMRDGSGYWFVASDGGVFAFGSAPFLGSRGASYNRRPIAGMAVTLAGEGYWLVRDDGLSYPFGDAPDFISSVAGPVVVSVEVLP